MAQDVGARSDFHLDIGEAFELLRVVLADRAEVAGAALYAADAVRIGVALPVHQWQLDTSTFNHGLAIGFRESALDQRRDDWTVRKRFCEVVEAVLLFRSEAENENVARPLDSAK